jgi:hypothetical protein
VLHRLGFALSFGWRFPGKEINSLILCQYALQLVGHVVSDANSGAELIYRLRLARRDAPRSIEALVYLGPQVR